MNEKIKRIQEGDKELLKQVIEENKEFIHSFTLKYYGVFEDYEDLVQESTCAFINSLYTFKFKGDFYENYARRYIFKNIERYILKNLHRITNKDKKYEFFMDLYIRAIKYYKHEPTAKELKKLLNKNMRVSEEVYNTVNGYIKYNSDALDVYEIRDDYSLEDECIKNVDTDLFVKRFFDNTLNDIQKNTLLKLYGFDNEKCYTFTEIAKSRGVSKQSVSLVHISAIKKLQKKKYNSLNKFYNL